MPTLAKSRVVVSVKSARRNTAPSGLLHYFATSKLDRDREGEQPRTLFDEARGNLTHLEARLLLSLDRRGPTQADLIHMVISVRRDEYARLGHTPDERRAHFEQAVREAMRVVTGRLEVQCLHWAGVTHLNTPNPHAHLAVLRDALDQQTGAPVRIKHLPRVLLPHNERLHDGSKEFAPGMISETIVRGLERHQLPMRVPENGDLVRDAHHYSHDGRSLRSMQDRGASARHTNEYERDHKKRARGTIERSR